MKRLLYMWQYPRMVAWFLAATLLFILARLPFMKAAVVPFCVEFQPAIVLVPLAGIFWGPAGALGILAGSLLGDVWMGMWGALSAYRAAGLFLYAYSAKRLWDYSMYCIGKQGGLTPHWGQTARFLYVSLPGCFLAASWPALGSELLRRYPFSYIFSLLLLNHAVFTVLLGPALYRILARELVPHFGCWRAVMSAHPMAILSRKGALFTLAGGIGAGAAGWVVGGLAYGIWPTQRFFFGEGTGPLVGWSVAPFMLLQVIGLFLSGSCVREVGQPTGNESCP